MSKKIIFQTSYMQRCGHNFLSEVLRIFLPVDTPVYDTSEIAISNVMGSIHKTIHKQSARFPQLIEWTESVCRDGIRKEILKRGTQEFIMIKNVNVRDFTPFYESFPDDYHLILFRDPRNTVTSFIKSVKLNKGKAHKVFIRKIAYYSGYYHYYFAKRVKNELDMFLTALEKLKAKENKKFILVTYESLVSGEDKELSKLIQFFNQNMDVDELKDKMSKIKILNSSYKHEEKNKNEVNSAKNKDFDPFNRWKKLPILQRKGLLLALDNIHQKMGY
ncbi:hypothetical protein [uncultured Kordia sp.]|uniref:hypothetical protein n=1 Tax=uncultured Kordia sp. TaxID=507699 RepID=UPI002625577F|nr:hypothetical protein [uncultured Kordia sp.]